MENWKEDGNEFVKEKFFIEDYERLYSDIIIAVLIKMDRRWISFYIYIPLSLLNVISIVTENKYWRKFLFIISFESKNQKNNHKNFLQDYPLLIIIFIIILFIMNLFPSKINKINAN